MKDLETKSNILTTISELYPSTQLFVSQFQLSRSMLKTLKDYCEGRIDKNNIMNMEFNDLLFSHPATCMPSRHGKRFEARHTRLKYRITGLRSHILSSSEEVIHQKREGYVQLISDMEKELGINIDDSLN